MSSVGWSLLFAGVSAICAIIGVPASIMACKNKTEAEKIKKQIESYQRNILEKQDLLLLVPRVEEIKDIKKMFRDLTGKATTKGIKRDDEIQNYIEIRDKVSVVLDDVPEQYEELRSLLQSIKDAFGHCILNEKTFNELDRESSYGYFTVENDLDDILAKMNTLTREIKF